MKAIERTTISRRGLLAGVAGVAAAAMAGVVTRAERAVAKGSDGEAVAVGAAYDDVRSPTSFKTTRHDATVMDFSSVDDSSYQRTVRIGPDGIHTARDGHWSRQSVTIDGAVVASGGGAAASAVGPMIVGEGDIMGVYGSADADGPGVMGRGAVGVEGVGSIGVSATGQDGPGIRAAGDRGGTFIGNVAQLRLQPSESPSHPAHGEPGDLFVDADRRLWFCRGGADWTRLA